MKLGLTALNPAHQHIDGIGVYTQNLLKHFAAKHYDIKTIPYQPLSNLPYSRDAFLPHPLALASAFTPMGPWFNRHIEKNIDLFHCTNYLIPRFKKIPVVATLFDAIMLKHPEWNHDKLLTLKNYLKKRSAQWADHYIAISHAMIPDLVNYWNIDEKNISVTHLGVADAWFQTLSEEEKNQVLQKYKLKNNFVLSVGTLQPRKNIARLIEAYQRLHYELQKAYPLVLVGKNGWQTDELIKTIRQLEEQKVLRWLTYVTQDDLRALYQSATLFAFPSLSEGFGLPLLEAFASKTPVLTSHLTSLPEIAGDAALLIDPYNTEEIAHGLITLLTQASLRKQLIQLGSERVREFSWQKCTQQTYKIYQSLT
jgi:glycosyltransferase involved in cell wall biosynthesis